MKKTFFNRLSIIVKWLTLFALMAGLGSCATNVAKPVNLGNQTINIGYLKNQDDGYFFIVENTSTQWTIKKISNSLLKRTNDTHEVIFISKNFNYLSPAFIPNPNEVGQDGFNCSWSAGNGYSPCGKTQLAVIDATQTVVGGAVLTVLSTGANVLIGMHFKTVDRDMISKIVKETDLINVAKVYDALLKKQVQYRRKLGKHHTDIIETAKWNVDMKDESGFYKGDIDFSNLIEKGEFSLHQLLHPEDFLPLTVNAAIASNIKMAIEQLSDELNDSFEEEQLHYKVSLGCPSNITHKGFNLHFSECPNFIDASPPRRPISVDVIVKSKNFSNVYPAFSGKDKNIRVEFDGSNVRITNTINKYIKVLSTSIYYNKVVESSENKSLNRLIGVIPPEAFTEERISSLTVNSPVEELVDYPEMTTAEARRKKIKFGFAIRYQIGDSEQYETFFKTKKYRLLNVLLAKSADSR